jgi:uncharacterized membrane-anchored protein
LLESYILAVCVIVIAGFFPIYAMMVNGDRQVGIPDLLVYQAVGLVSVSLFSLIMLSVGVITAGVVFIPAAIAGICVIKKSVPVHFRFPQCRLTLNNILSATIVVLFFGLVLWQGFRMAGGEYPQYFYNIDSAYYLGQVQSLVKSIDYPPPSLCNAGYSPGYHYAVQNMAASLSRFSGVSPHTCLFGFVFPILVFGVIGVIVLLKDVIASDLPGPLYYAVMLYLGPIPIMTIITAVQTVVSDHSFTNGWVILVRDLYISPKISAAYFPLLSSYLGYFLFMVIVYSVLNSHGKRMGLLLFISLTSLVAAKSPYFVAAGGGVGLIALLQTCKKQYTLLAIALASLVSAVVLIFVLSPEGSTTLRVSPWYYFVTLADRSVGAVFPVQATVFLILKGSAKYLLKWIMPIMVILYCLVVYQKKRDATFWHSVYVSCWLIAPLCFVNIFVLTSGTMTELYNNGNIQQVLGLSASCFAIITVLLLNSRMPLFGAKQARVFGIVGVILLGYPLSQQLYCYYNYLTGNWSGFQYVDNRNIAEALHQIPVAKTVLVSNDLRYPAYTDSDDLRQVQIPAIYGHQAYASNFKYEHAPGYEEKKKQYRLLQKTNWDRSLNKAVLENNWSVFLVKKGVPFPTDGPFDKTFENQEYAVYMFDLTQLRGEKER